MFLGQERFLSLVQMDGGYDKQQSLGQLTEHGIVPGHTLAAGPSIQRHFEFTLIYQVLLP